MSAIVRACNTSYEPATDRYIGTFTPHGPGTVTAIHSPAVVRLGHRGPAVIHVDHGEYSLGDVVNDLLIGAFPLAGTWTLSMARPPDWPVSPPPELHVTLEVDDG